MTDMTGSEFIAARERAGLSLDDAAAALDLTPGVVAAWEAGTVRIPRRVAQEMTWRAAAAQRRAALATSGLPECGWVAAWEREPPATSTKKQLRRLEAFTKHAAACPTCRAREQYVAERFPPMPPRPLTGWLAIVGWFKERIDRLPAWLRPAAWGAVIFFAMTAIRVVLSTPEWLHAPGGWLAALTALPAGAGVGAVVGALFGVVRAVRTAWRMRRAPGHGSAGQQMI